MSIIIPCYNGAAYVRYAVLSALNQSYPHVEVVVVDDGSTDDSLAVLAEFGDRVTTTSIARSGPSRARNVGLERSRGEFLQFLDADNLLTADKLERSVAELLAHPEAGAVFSAMHVPGAHDFTDQTIFTAEELRASVDGMLDRAYGRVLPGTGIPSLETSQPLFRRSVLSAYGAWDEELSVLEDTELVGRLALCGVQFRHLPMVGVIYRDHPGERVTNRMRFDNDDYFRAVLKMIDVARDRGRLTGAIEEFSVNYLVWIAARECIRERRFARARRYLAHARAIRPQLPGPPLFRMMSRLVGSFAALAAAQLVLTASVRVLRRPPPGVGGWLPIAPT